MLEHYHWQLKKETLFNNTDSWHLFRLALTLDYTVHKKHAKSRDQLTVCKVNRYWPNDKFVR